MAGTLLVGRGRSIEAIDEKSWREKVAASTGHEFPFLTADHHRVRNFAVRTLPQCGRQGLSLDRVAHALALAPARVRTVVAELERHLFFLVRNRAGAVAWAFPVTVDATAHQLRLNTGERAFGA